MSVLVGAVSPASGRAFVAGHDVVNDSEAAFKGIGYTAEHNQLPDKITMLEILKLFSRLRGATEIEAIESATFLMNSFRITEYQNKRLNELSGGTKRKLQLAVAVTGLPTAQVHDEPSAGTDIFAQQQMWKYLRKISQH